MNLRNLFRVSAVFGMIVGLTWLLAPEAMPASYGIDLDPYAAYYLQQLGTINIALGVLFFLVSGLAHSPARQAVVTFFFVQQVLSALVSLFAVFGDVLPGNVGWTAVVSNLVFALAFGYFRFVRSEAGLTPETQS
jgi:hypothetical protein